MSRLAMLLAAAFLFATVPAGAGEAPETGTIQLAALTAAPDGAGGQCLAVPARCGAGAAAERALRMANSCKASCNSTLQTCYTDCDSASNIWSCRNTCDNDYDDCAAAC